MEIELELWQVKALRNYFGINDKSSLEHWAYAVFDNALNSEVSYYDVYCSGCLPRTFKVLKGENINKLVKEHIKEQNTRVPKSEKIKLIKIKKRQDDKSTSN